MPRSDPVASDTLRNVSSSFAGLPVELSLQQERQQSPIGSSPFHSWELPNGENWAAFYRSDKGLLIRFEGLADFEVWNDGARVTCWPSPATDWVTIEHLYLNQIIPVALNKQGCHVFHASAVSAGDVVLAFLGKTGSGKSTLAAGFSKGGHAILTDDCLVLERDGEGRHLAFPGHPSIRLWSESIHLLEDGDWNKTPAIGYSSKGRFIANSASLHCSQAKELRAAFFIDSHPADTIAITPISGAEAMLGWAQHTFIADNLDKGLLAGHFECVSSLASEVACFRLEYPRKYEALDELRDRILTQLKL